MLLLREDLWCVTSKTSLRSTTPTHQSTWDSKDQKTRATIFLTMKDIQRVHVKFIKKKKRSLGYFEELIPSSKCHECEFLTTKFYTLKMKKGEDIKKHITKFCNLLNQLTIIGATISNGVVACAY
jgi:hypothetical protein